jgi:hypothetical protein
VSYHCHQFLLFLGKHEHEGFLVELLPMKDRENDAQYQESSDGSGNLHSETAVDGLIDADGCQRLSLVRQ